MAEPHDREADPHDRAADRAPQAEGRSLSRLCSEEEAADYLRDKCNFFKLASYRKLFSKYGEARATAAT